MILAIASGKGGTGKTTIAAALARTWDALRIAVDMDVEAMLRERPAGIVLNKADLDPTLADFIETFCNEQGYPVLARIPYLPSVVWALAEGRTMDEVEDGGIADAIRRAWRAVAAHVSATDGEMR